MIKVALAMSAIAIAFLGAAAGYLYRDNQELASPQWNRCVDTASGYAVEYPAAWHYDAGRLACRFFDPEPFTVPETGDFGGTALEVHPLDESYDDALAALIDTRFAETEVREEVDVGGKRAHKLEFVATGAGLADRGTRTYAYLIRNDHGPPVLVQTTSAEGETLGYRAIVDRAAHTLRLFPPAEPAAGAPNDPLLPEAVAEKRAALLEAADAGDYDALAALADEDEFNYSFGGPVEGGPAAYWRAEAARGNDPLEALRVILRLPYTLTTGVYAWPFAYDKTDEALTEYERSLLEPLETTFLDGAGYFGWRAGIRPDGSWVFFVAGD